MENVEDIDLDIVDRKEDGWKFIGFRYKEDIIGDDKLVEEVKTEMFTKIKKRIEDKKDMFKGYHIWNMRVAGHFLRPHWINQDHMFFKIIIIVAFQRKVEDVKHGMLFRF
jgi:hypothetical protein